MYVSSLVRGKSKGLAATLWWLTAAPKPLKIQVFWGSPSPQGSYSPYILGDTTRPGHVTCVLVWSKSDRRRLRKTLHKQTDKQTHTTKIMVTWPWTKNVIHFHRNRQCGWISLDRRLIQEGQHPLTGQSAANFRLLVNQWAERRPVTQSRHGCRAMSRNVCNAGASNGGRSLCIQISRERSYLLPKYSYHSKGNWLRYNLCRWQFLYNETLQQTFRPLLSKFSKRWQI